MRRLLIIWVPLLLLGLFCGYWLVAQAQIKRAVTVAMERLPAYGWQANLDTLHLRGFPFRFDVMATDVSAENLAGTLAWQAPALNIHALSYQPNRIVAALPPQQQVTLYGQRIDVQSADMRVSTHVGLSPDLPLDEAVLEARDLALTSEFGWQAQVSHLLSALRAAPDVPADSPPTYDAYTRAQNLVLPEAIRAALDPSGVLPAAVASVEFDTRLSFDAPIDRYLTPQVAPTSVNLRRIHLQWGQMQLTATGTLQPGSNGLAEGEIALSLNGWQQLVTLAENAGALVPDRAQQLRFLLGAAAGGGDRLSLTLTVSQGVLSYGPVPLMPLPRMLQPQTP
ncbi:DUF2125 domain-containing protein [Ketogulonicigenium vulgare]|nr:DUF2125 domain-containing protein [Ketogulonicigenium vulgare]